MFSMLGLQHEIDWSIRPVTLCEEEATKQAVQRTAQQEVTLSIWMLFERFHNALNSGQQSSGAAVQNLHMKINGHTFLWKKKTGTALSFIYAARTCTGEWCPLI